MEMAAEASVPNGWPSLAGDSVGAWPAQLEPGVHRLPGLVIQVGSVASLRWLERDRGKLF